MLIKFLMLYNCAVQKIVNLFSFKFAPGKAPSVFYIIGKGLILNDKFIFIESHLFDQILDAAFISGICFRSDYFLRIKQ
jgi:hypothetical protein